jgi:peptidoglycan/LPS O-acetylase OafA/YrhL
MRIYEILLYIITFILVLIFHNKKNEIFLTLLLILILLQLCIIYINNKSILITIIIIGLCMPLVEIICVKFKIWKYLEVNYLIIPLWLFPLLAIATCFIISIYNNINLKKLF